MKPRQMLAETTTSEGKSLTLYRRDDDYTIDLDGEELMSTRAPGSEVALATLGCERLTKAERPRVLIGGLGLGYTLRAALDVLPRNAEVVVAELFPAVVQWNRTHLAHLHNATLDDSRVRIVTQDVWDLLGPDPRRDGYDAVLLDVDNGPAAWTLDANGRLYDRQGIERIRNILRPGGTLAIWAAQPDPQFAKRMKKSGFEVVQKIVQSRGAGGNRRHAVILVRPSPKARLRTRPRSKGRR